MTVPELDEIQAQIQTCADPEKLERIALQLSEALCWMLRMHEIQGTAEGRAIYALRKSGAIATNQSEIRDFFSKIGVRA